ncbi:MAG: metallopeptidase family protein [Candidatus Omnitrophica bacterium]|nr:metallopeptidase family protein [Candidatus Omnitrophota bacterium]
MKRVDFEALVLKAVNELPKAFGEKLENIDIVIEDAPNIEAARKLGLGSMGHLLGLYQGVPLKDRTHYYGMVMPDKITLYKDNIEQACAVKGESVYDEIKHVIQHEIAHHFGISDKRLKDLGIY